MGVWVTCFVTQTGACRRHKHKHKHKIQRGTSSRRRAKSSSLLSFSVKVAVSSSDRRPQWSTSRDRAQRSEEQEGSDCRWTRGDQEQRLLRQVWRPPAQHDVRNRRAWLLRYRQHLLVSTSSMISFLLLIVIYKMHSSNRFFVYLEFRSCPPPPPDPTTPVLCLFLFGLIYVYVAGKSNSEGCM